MDIHQFIVGLVRALAWPVVVLLCVLIIRKPVFALLSFVSRIRYKDLEIHFAEKFENVHVAATTLLAATPNASEYKELDYSYFTDLAARSARATILEAWAELEASIFRLGEIAGIHPRGSRQTFSYVFHRMLEAKLIREDSKEVIQDLRSLRNEIVHIPDELVDSRWALKYVAAVKDIRAVIEGSSEKR